MQLRSELKTQYEFVTEGDTEVILAAYEKWGIDCVKRFNGDWAFSIYDKKRKRVFISRDRFGIKPLFYSVHNNKLIFASEITALLEVGIPSNITIDSLAYYLRFRRSEHRTKTLLKNIYCLEPGNNLIIDLEKSKLKIIEYYGRNDLVKKQKNLTLDDVIEEFNDIFTDAVKLRMKADVTIQILLSGGLDSSAISALAGVGQDEINTLSYVSKGSEHDESYYSDLVANFIKSNHVSTQIEHNSFFDVFDEVIRARNTPTCSEKHVARFSLYKKAAEFGKVVIEGQGGDEVFGGYGAMYRIYNKFYAKKYKKPMAMTLMAESKKSASQELAELNDGILSRLPKLQKDFDIMDSDDPYLKQQFSIIRNNLLALLHTGDHLQMHHSIEGRYPFMDHRLIEMGLSLPVNMKMYGYDKYLLLEYLSKNKILPDEIVFRTDKKGFSTSIGGDLIKSKNARHKFEDVFQLGYVMFPEIFDEKAIKTLLDEQYLHGINNNKRLLSIYSLIKYLSNNKINIIQ